MRAHDFSDFGALLCATTAPARSVCRMGLPVPPECCATCPKHGLHHQILAERGARGTSQHRPLIWIDW
jgi:hypothetical protein